ncbi:LON peptidase substrate-binding domain-containing protein, partial [Desulfobulbus sp. F3]|nr:LON peptidase substrate-binding domain-containing protein [Desulfobulbus sp. F3]
MQSDDSLSSSMDDFADSVQDADIPEELPMMAVRDVVVFNYMILPLFVGRPNSVSAVNEAMNGGKMLMLVTQKEVSSDKPEADDLYEVGMVVQIMRSLKLPDGRLKVLVQALAKAKITDYKQKEPHFRVGIALVEEDEPSTEITVEIEALMRLVREQTEKIMSLRGALSADLMGVINSIEEPGRLADLVGSNLRLKIAESQKILETVDPLERLRLVANLLNKELEVAAVQAKIQSDAREEMSKSQREYYLREQMQALKKELGDDDSYTEDIEELQKKISKKKLPKHARKEALKELKRLEMMHPDASEANIIRTYIEWIIDLPWKKSSTDLLDLVKAAKVLDEDHFGLEKVKERILEFLAVRKLNTETKGPILCFVGPPGVGKT